VPVLHWGMFRAGNKRWIHPREVVPPNSSLDERSGGMRTLLEARPQGALEARLRVPAELAPVTLACTGCAVDSASGRAEYLSLRSGLHCSIPLGMSPGSAEPLGATVGSTAVNFAVASRAATAVSLVLIRDRSRAGQENTCLEVALDPYLNRTGDIWHVSLSGLDLGALRYGWRLEGDPSWRGRGRFNPSRVMLDPYSKLVADVGLPPAARLSDQAPRTALLGCLDDEGAPAAAAAPSSTPRVPLESMVLYEVDVVSFTQESSVPEGRRGKLIGVLDRLDHLKSVGATTVVLSPVYAQKEGLGAGGKAALNYFSPEPSLSVANTSSGTAAELKEVVSALHGSGIEVVLQFDFCFTAEGTDDKPKVLSFRGVDYDMYYRPSGVLNCGQVMVRRMICDAMRHWAAEYSVDGFGVLHSETLCQDSNGVVLDSPRVVEALSLDPILRHCKLIAYVGDRRLLPRSGDRGFPHWGVWLQVNDKFADTARDYLSGRETMASALATAIAGSPDLLAARWDADLPGCLAAGRRPAFGLNVLGSREGAGLARLGAAVCGRGPQPPPGAAEPDACAATAAKSLLTLQMLSQGTPMLSHDFVGEATLLSFASGLLSLRSSVADLVSPPEFDTPRGVHWFGAAEGSAPDWDGALQHTDGGKVVAVALGDLGGRAVFMAFNPHDSAVRAAVPERPPGAAPWSLAVDTGRPAPGDLPEPPTPLAAGGGPLRLQPRAAVVLLAL